jgi:hypothetical protein
MKKVSVYLIIFFSGITFCVDAATRTWVGISGALWSVAANWLPAVVPVAGDDLIFNTNGTVNIDATGPFDINTLTVTNLAAVIFDCGGTRNFRLYSTSVLNPALLIDAGATLTVDGSNAGINNSSLNLTFASGVIGSIYGTLIMSKTGGAPSSPGVQIITDNNLTNYGILTVYAGGRININVDAGNTSSLLSPVPTLVMLDGSVYETFKNGGSFPTGTWQPNSLAKASGVGSNGPSFNGNNYGNLEWNCPGMTAITFLNADVSFNNVNIISTNSLDPSGEFRIKTSAAAGTWTMTINGNLDIGINARLVTTAANVTTGNGGIILLRGNLNNLGTITTNNVTAGTVNAIEFSNTVSNQNISNSGTLSGNLLDFILNNSNGATLLTAIILPYRYSITSGNLILGNNDLTTPSINQVGVPSATLNHVVTNGTGKLIINNIGVSPVIFPIGPSAVTYNPITISNGGTLNYGARVETGINPTILVPIRGVNRTWIVRPSGNPPGTVNVDFVYFPGDGNGSFNYLTNVEIGFYTSVWNVINYNVTPMGTYLVAGTVDIFAANSDAPLVVANLGAILSSSNSVSIDHFTGIKQNNAHVLNWKLTCNSSSYADIEMERSTDGQNYKSIYSMHATALRCQQPFNYNDADPTAGINYYRLKIMDDHGKISYSSIASLLNAAKGVDILNITPNPVVGSSFDLKISAAEATQMEIIITDMQGRVLQKKAVNMIAGFNTIPMHVRNLAAGTYQLFGNSEDGRTRVLRFVIQ